MFDKRFLWTTASVLIVALIAVVATNLPIDKNTALQEDVSGIEIIRQETSIPEYLYLIKEHEGRIAVFSVGKVEPDIILSVYVKYLPEFDRQQMKDGIEVNSYDELMTLLEDYSS